MKRANKGRTKGELRASIDKEGKNDKNILLSQLAPGEPDERTGAKPKKKPKVFDHDSKPYQAAEYMAKKILARVPTYIHLQEGKREKTLQGWAKDIDLLLRIDKADFDEFKRVLQFSQTDSFWQKNILSGKKLRDQYGALLVKMAGDRE